MAPLGAGFFGEQHMVYIGAVAIGFGVAIYARCIGMVRRDERILVAIVAVIYAAAVTALQRM
jgi:uncharacterized membrane protein YczE